MFVGMLGVMMLSTFALAQDSAGQLCLRAYEDRNANMVYDEGEPFIAKDVGVNLANAEGVIVQTALLDDSPRASQGLMCFQNLASGQYTLIVASAAYLPTLNTAFIATVSQSSVPQVFDYGAQVIASELPTPSPTGQVSPLQLRALLQRVLFGSLGAAVVMTVVGIIGVILYFLFVRPKPVTAYAPEQAYMRPDTGAMPIAEQTRVVREVLPPTEGDTDRFKPPKL